jgi:hypothetical protein
MTTAIEIVALHKAEPELTAVEIAMRLGCASSHVRATAARRKLQLPKAPRGKLAAVEMVRRIESWNAGLEAAAMVVRHAHKSGRLEDKWPLTIMRKILDLRLEPELTPHKKEPTYDVD